MISHKTEAAEVCLTGAELHADCGTFRDRACMSWATIGENYWPALYLVGGQVLTASSKGKAGFVNVMKAERILASLWTLD